MAGWRMQGGGGSPARKRSGADPEARAEAQQEAGAHPLRNEMAAQMEQRLLGGLGGAGGGVGMARRGGGGGTIDSSDEAQLVRQADASTRAEVGALQLDVGAGDVGAGVHALSHTLPPPATWPPLAIGDRVSVYVTSHRSKPAAASTPHDFP